MYKQKHTLMCLGIDHYNRKKNKIKNSFEFIILSLAKFFFKYI